MYGHNSQVGVVPQKLDAVFAPNVGVRFRITPIYQPGKFEIGGIYYRKKTGCSLVEVIDETGVPMKEPFIAGPSYEEFGWLYRNNAIADAESLAHALLEPEHTMEMNLRTFMTRENGVSSARAGELLP